jgi:hypothetical protein
MPLLLSILDRLHWSTWLGIVVVSVVALAMHVRFTRRAAAMGPTLLTTLGIGFCFFGIALGLLDFDPDDIRGSVPSLIDGIRTAFWVSVCGIVWAVTIKLRLFAFGDPPATQGVGCTLGDVAGELRRLRAAISEDDTALVTHVRLLHDDGIERLDKLQRSFDQFGESVVEANSKALIEALSVIIRDFNTELNEQVGGNFARLNEAAEKLVAWQEQHKADLEDLIQHQTLAADLMGEATERYNDLVKKAAVFMRISESLAIVLPNLERQTQVLERSSRTLGDSDSGPSDARSANAGSSV